MQTITVEGWKDFESRLREIKRTIKAGPVGLLFRGQADASWSLQTTLERSCRRMDSVHQYYCIIREITAQIETFTDLSFEAPGFEEIWSIVHDYAAFSHRMASGKLPGYRYMIYLRHHGFPTPLLDWSRSPYVAAYFAFAKATAENASIYVFAEQPENIKIRGAAAPAIYSFGPIVRSHRRHFLQQSTYTVCARFELPGMARDSNTEWKFGSHQDVFLQNDAHQDLLWKFVIPSAERIEVLKHLEDYNFNAMSLFGTEESLLETLAIRVMDFRT
jgi:hypothetical protein